jgi:hypothetical protein
LAWRITDHIDGGTPAAPLAQPSHNDTARYAALLRTTIGDDPLLADPAQATLPPRLLHTDPVTGHIDHQRLLAAVVGDTEAAATAHQPAWPALRAAIRRAEHAGHDPLTVVATAVLSRPLHGARSTAQVLAWRINHHLATTPAAAEPHSVDAWRTLAWTLKAAETRGTLAEVLLANIRPGSDLDGVRQQIHAYTCPAPLRVSCRGFQPTRRPRSPSTPATYATPTASCTSVSTS